jgi:hypothetical protein
MVTWSSFPHFQLFHYESGAGGGRVTAGYIKIKAYSYISPVELNGGLAELGNYRKCVHTYPICVFSNSFFHSLIIPKERKEIQREVTS